MINFEELTEKYKYVRMVRPEDNQDLHNFLESISMECGPLDIQYSRKPDIFASFNEQSDRYYIFVYLNNDFSIGGFGSLIIKKMYINEEFVEAGYYADMRLSPKLGRKGHIQSRQIYAESLKRYKEIEEIKNVKYFYTAILKNNEKALNALTKNKRGIHYHKITEYRVQSLLKINYRKPNDKFNVSYNKNFNYLESYLKKISFQENPSQQNTITIERDGKVLMSAVLKKMKYRNLIITRASLSLMTLGRLLPLLKRPSIKVKKEFVQRYITDIVFYDSKFSKDELMNELLSFIRLSNDYSTTHAYSFIVQKSDDLTKSLSRCFTEETIGILFQVTSDLEDKTISANDSTLIGFDICTS